MDNSFEWSLIDTNMLSFSLYVTLFIISVFFLSFMHLLYKHLHIEINALAQSRKVLHLGKILF